MDKQEKKWLYSLYAAHEHNHSENSYSAEKFLYTNIFLLAQQVFCSIYPLSHALQGIYLE